MKKAKEIMQNNPDIKIKTLAEMLGYNSSMSFIRTFKKIEGIPPGAFIDDILKNS